MSEELELQITEDGSPTLYSTQFQECYHSMRGALSESKHICIDNGLSTLTCEPQIRILEYGFGLGMNLWVAIQWAIQNAKTIDYTTLELYPVPLEMVSLVRCLEPSEVEILWREAHKTPWEISCSLSPQIALTKQCVDFMQYLPPVNTFHIVFFDAFSPLRVPEQWGSELFTRIFDALLLGGCLVTYSASGKVKQALRKAGFRVHRRLGALGKHHMLVAKK